jgi:hypothetical protein
LTKVRSPLRTGRRSLPSASLWVIW